MIGAFVVLVLSAFVDEPATSYIFPAGGQRGTTVDCRVGGVNLSGECGFRILGTGVEAPERIRSTPTLLLPGPYHQNPIAQQAFDYPKDLAARIRISPEATPGVRFWYCTTSEGASQLRPFVVGDLPEILEDERKTSQGKPQKIVLPVTINGRIYPRGDLDEYEFSAKAGDLLNCEVVSQRLGYKLDARLELFDAEGRSVAVNDTGPSRDPILIATLPADGRYVLRIHDIAFEGNQDYIYRLTVRIGPSISHVYPAGGRRGSLSRIRFYGPGLSREGFLDRELVLDPLVLLGRNSPPESEDPSPILSSADFLSLMPNSRGSRQPVSPSFQLGNLPEVLEIEPNQGEHAQRISTPAVLNGQINPVGDVDEFVFSAAKGEKLDLELFGRRIGSPITAVVAILDAKGKQILRQEGDGVLSFASPADGSYTIRVEELHHETHGGSEYVYRLVVAPPRPEFRLAIEKDSLGVLPGQSTKIKVNVVRSGGFSGEIPLEFQNLPPGVKASPALIPPGAKQVEIAFSAAGDAPVGETRRVVLLGRATLNGELLLKAAEVPVAGSLPGVPPPESLAVTVIHPALFTIDTEELYGFAKRGATFAQRFTIKRLAGFEGEIELGIADRQARYLQGATGPTILVKPEVNDVVYPAFLPETMDLNRTCRIVLSGTARIRDANGRTHVVTHTMKKQIVVRVCPGLLTMSAEDRLVEIPPGRESLVRLRLARTPELAGPVTIEPVLPEESHGLMVHPVDVPEGEETVTIPIRRSPGATLGDQDSILFRASARYGGYPVVAETTVRLQLKPLPR